MVLNLITLDGICQNGSGTFLARMGWYIRN